MKGWKWFKCKEGSYLKSSLIESAGFNHIFFTKEWGSRSPDELNKYLDKRATPYFTKQVHKSQIISASESNNTNSIEADGIISDKLFQSLWVYTADCLPVLIADKSTGRVCTCHAGWRGISEKILSKSIGKMKFFGSELDNLLIAIGPSIDMKNYQVGEEVALKISTSCIRDIDLSDGDKSKKITALMKLKILYKDTSNNRFRLDLNNAAINQICNSGIRQESISICPISTFTEKQFFNSWRRDKIKASQWSAIAVRGSN